MPVTDGYMTREEVEQFLNVTKRRVYQLRDAGLIKPLKGGVYETKSVKAYKEKRKDKAGGPYPKERGSK
jgi:hypothetical protein